MNTFIGLPLPLFDCLQLNDFWDKLLQNSIEMNWFDRFLFFFRLLFIYYYYYCTHLVLCSIIQGSCIKLQLAQKQLGSFTSFRRNTLFSVMIDLSSSSWNQFDFEHFFVYQSHAIQFTFFHYFQFLALILFSTHFAISHFHTRQCQSTLRFLLYPVSSSCWKG